MINSNKPKATQSPIRGAIRTLIKNSNDNLVAGEEFSIFVTVQNPFEVPLTLHRVSTHIPTEFYDVDQRAQELQAFEIEEERAEIAKAGKSLGLDTGVFLPSRVGFLKRLCPVFLRCQGIMAA